MTKIQIPTAAEVLAAMEARALKVFTGIGRDGVRRVPDLNLIGLRRRKGTLDLFDDLIVALWHDANGAPVLRAWQATLDPGKASIEHPTRRDGTAVMALGQHRAAFQPGMHYGSKGATPYRCLVPVSTIPVDRYKSLGDYEAGRSTRSSSTDTQIHRASAVNRSTRVGPWSVGCAVFAEDSEFDEFMALCDAQAAAGLGARYTFTILEWDLVDIPA